MRAMILIASDSIRALLHQRLLVALMLVTLGLTVMFSVLLAQTRESISPFLENAFNISADQVEVTIVDSEYAVDLQERKKILHGIRVSADWETDVSIYEKPDDQSKTVNTLTAGRKMGIDAFYTGEVGVIDRITDGKWLEIGKGGQSLGFVYSLDVTEIWPTGVITYTDNREESYATLKSSAGFETKIIRGPFYTRIETKVKCEREGCDRISLYSTLKKKPNGPPNGPRTYNGRMIVGSWQKGDEIPIYAILPSEFTNLVGNDMHYCIYTASTCYPTEMLRVSAPGIVLVEKRRDRAVSRTKKRRDRAVSRTNVTDKREYRVESNEEESTESPSRLSTKTGRESGQVNVNDMEKIQQQGMEMAGFVTLATFYWFTALGGTLVALFICSTAVANDIRSGTIRITLSKPVSRTQFLLGKYCGAVVVMLGYSILIGIALVIFAYANQLGVSPAARYAPWLMFCSNLMVGSVALLLSLLMHPLIAAVVAYFASASFLSSPNPLYFILPSYDRYNVFSLIMQGKLIALEDIFMLTLYAFDVAAIFVLLALWRFRSKELL